ETRLLCRHHYELCGSHPGEPGGLFPDGTGGVFGGSGGGTSSGGASLGGADVMPCQEETRPIVGCSAAPLPSPAGLGSAAAALLLLLGFVGMLRRRRS